MFQFAALASSIEDDGHPARRVAPFGDPGINGHLHLPRAFRCHVLLRLREPRHPPRALVLFISLAGITSRLFLFDIFLASFLVQFKDKTLLVSFVIH